MQHELSSARLKRTNGSGGSDRPASERRCVSRRRFIRAAGGVVAGVAVMPVLSACTTQPAAAPTATAPPAATAQPAAQAGPGGFSGGGSLRLMMRSHYIPAFDQWLDKFVADWGEKNNVSVGVDHLQAGELPAKWAAEVASKAGHDLLGFTQSGAITLYHDHLVDVSDVANEVADRHGGWLMPLADRVGTVDGEWLGVPDYFIDFPASYRKDLFDANGLKPVDTYQDLLKAGELLKPKEHPIGLGINQKSNDANNSWNSMLWGFGASYVGEDGKTVTLDSPETREAVNFAVELYNKTMTNEVLSWDDAGNNQFLASGRGSWIQNPISAYRTIERTNPELAEKIYISNAPAGPKGRFASVSTSTWGIWKWSENAPAAKAFLTEYYANMKEALKAATGYNQPMLLAFRQKPMIVLGDDPKLKILQDFGEIARASGHPGPPTVASAEVDANWVIPLMIGRAVRGDAEGAITWAVEKVESIYAKHV